MTWDAKGAFNADPDTNVTSYTVFFNVNGNAAGSVNVSRTSAGDSGGYSALYSQISPAPAALKPGDVIVITAEATDSFNQNSPIVPFSPASLTVPTPPAPPTGPTNCVASLVGP